MGNKHTIAPKGSGKSSSCGRNFLFDLSPSGSKAQVLTDEIQNKTITGIYYKNLVPFSNLYAIVKYNPLEK